MARKATVRFNGLVNYEMVKHRIEERLKKVFREA